MGRVARASLTRRLFDGTGKILKVLRFREVFIDTREPDIGDAVQPFQAFHHQRTYGSGRDFTIARRFDLALNSGRQLADLIGRNGALAARHVNRAFQFFTLEGLAFAFAFDDRQFTKLDALKGRKTRAARFALSTTTDRVAIFSRATIFDLTVFIRAKWAAHLGLPPVQRQPSKPLIDRKTVAQCADTRVDGRFNCGIAMFALRPQPLENIGDHVADVTEFGGSESASRAGG